MEIAFFVSLVAMLIVATAWPLQKVTLPEINPLDIDKGLPFPEAGQGSSIFSLTALFGPYLVIVLLLGCQTLIGLAVGSIAGFYAIQNAINKSSACSYEQWIREKQENSIWTILLLAISITQIALAASEVYIFKEVVKHALGLGEKYAIIFSITVSLFGYYYCLTGGYVAVFRTDILQYILIFIFVVVSSVVALSDPGTNFQAERIFGLLPALWFSGESEIIRLFYSAICCGIVGFGFVVSSPDTWKRIFVISRNRRKQTLVPLVLAGMIPFMCVIPLAYNIPLHSITDLPSLKFVIVYLSNKGNVILVVFLIGLASSYLSSFDSALVTSIHSHLLTSKNTQSGRWVYMRDMGIGLLIVNAVVFCLYNAGCGNPYIIANFGMGLCSTSAGVIIGTNGLSRRISRFSVLLIFSIMFCFWLVGLSLVDGIMSEPKVEQIVTVQYGVATVVFVSLYCFVLSSRHR